MILNPFPPFLNRVLKKVPAEVLRRCYYHLMKFSCFYQLFHRTGWGNMLHIHSGCLSQGLNNRRD